MSEGYFENVGSQLFDRLTFPMFWTLMPFVTPHPHSLVSLSFPRRDLIFTFEIQIPYTIEIKHTTVEFLNACNSCLSLLPFCKSSWKELNTRIYQTTFSDIKRSHSGLKFLIIIHSSLHPIRIILVQVCFQISHLFRLISVL